MLLHSILLYLSISNKVLVILDNFFGYNSDEVYSYLSRQSDYQNLVRGYVPRDAISIVLKIKMITW